MGIGAAVAKIFGAFQIVGGTTGATIGNVGDKLKVEASFPNVTTTVPSWSNKLRYDDMNVANGGVARGASIPNSATWTTLYTYSGSGFIGGFICNVETFSTGWEFRLIVDGQTIFSLLDTDLAADAIYDVDDITDVNQAFFGLSKGSHDRFLWHPPMFSPLYYSSSVVVQLRRQAGAKKFQAGLIVLSKET